MLLATRHASSSVSTLGRFELCGVTDSAIFGSWLIIKASVRLVKGLAPLVKALPPLKLSAVIHNATRYLKINVVETFTDPRHP